MSPDAIPLMTIHHPSQNGECSGLKGKAVLIQMPETKEPSEESSAAATHTVWDTIPGRAEGEN